MSVPRKPRANVSNVTEESSQRSERRRISESSEYFHRSLSECPRKDFLWRIIFKRMPADAHLLICTVSNFIRAQRLSKCLLQRGGRTRCSFNATYYRDEYVSASSRCLGLFETASNRQKVVIMARDNVDSSLSFPPFFFQTRGAYV